MPIGSSSRSLSHVCVAVLAAVLVFVSGCSSTTKQRSSSDTARTTTSAAPSSAPAGPQKPLDLRQYVTDLAGAFDASARGDVESAIDRLYDERRIRLWVVFARDFARIEPGSSAADNAIAWAKSTMQASKFGTTDAIFAVATEGRAYAIQMPAENTSVSQPEIDGLLSSVKPDLQRGEWKNAAVLVANGIRDAAGSP